MKACSEEMRVLQFVRLTMSPSKIYNQFATANKIRTQRIGACVRNARAANDESNHIPFLCLWSRL